MVTVAFIAVTTALASLAPLILNLASVRSAAAASRDLGVPVMPACGSPSAGLVLCHGVGDWGGSAPAMFLSPLEALRSNGLTIFIVTNDFQELQHLQMAKKMENLVLSEIFLSSVNLISHLALFFCV